MVVAIPPMAQKAARFHSYGEKSGLGAYEGGSPDPVAAGGPVGAARTRPRWHPRLAVHRPAIRPPRLVGTSDPGPAPGLGGPSSGTPQEKKTRLAKIAGG